MVAIGLRVPRAATAIARYTGKDALQASYTQQELDAVAAAIAGHTALIDLGTTSGRQCVLMSVELGRRGLSLQWTPESWYWAVGSWRPGWAVPTYTTAPERRVVAATRVGTAKPFHVGPHFAVVAAH